MARARIRAPSPIFSAVELRRELRQEERRKLDASIKALRQQVTDARRALASETRKAKSDCVADLRKRIADLTKQISDARATLRDASKEKRQTKLRACNVVASEKRREKQAELDASRKALRDDLSLRRAGRVGAQRGERPERVTVRQESDAEVIRNLEAEDPTLVPSFQKRRRSFKSTRDQTRTEAFLEWASKHEEEIAAERAASVPSDEDYAAEMARAYGRPYDEAPF